MITPPRLGFLTEKDATSSRSWSGTPYFMSEALKRRGYGLTHINTQTPWLLSALKARHRIERVLTGRRGLPGQTSLYSARAGRIAERLLAENSVDAVFAVAASPTIASVSTDLPVFYSSDATARVMFDYYPRFTGLKGSARRAADEIERAAIARADVLIYPTRWAARSAVEDYGADESKIVVAAYGANLDSPPDRAEALAVRREGPFRLLFVGVDWDIKGGDIAVAAFASLRGRGVDCVLTICGCTPPDGTVLPEGVEVIPFLDKSDAAQAARFRQLYVDADLFLLPTRCECYGIVFCEAAAFGLPVVATATGGVPEVVVDGVGGETLPVEADGDAFAAVIEAIVADESRHEALRRSSRDRYETVLNWDAWESAVDIEGRLAEVSARAVG